MWETHAGSSGTSTWVGGEAALCPQTKRKSNGLRCGLAQPAGLRPAWGAVQRAGVDLGSSPSLQLCPAAGLLGTPVPALGPSLPRTCVAQGRHMSRSALHRQLPLPRSPHQPAPAGACHLAGGGPGSSLVPLTAREVPRSHNPHNRNLQMPRPLPPLHRTPAWSILVGVRKPAV